jgi:hypothetical protein
LFFATSFSAILLSWDKSMARKKDFRTEYERFVKQEATDAAVANGGIPVGSDDWKAYVADAVAKGPANRTQTEQEAIKLAMKGARSRSTHANEEIVTLQEFKAMAKRGRIYNSAEDKGQPSKSELANAQSPLDFGRLYGCSEDDIACFYLTSRGGRTEIAYAEYICDLNCAKFPPSDPSLQDKGSSDPRSES